MPLPRPAAIALRALAGLAAAAYPFLVWYGLTRWGARASALVLLAFLVLWGVRRGVTGRSGFRALLVQGGGLAAILIGTVVSGEPAVLQQVPVLINAFLLATFAATLLRPPPMIERYARLAQPDLSPAEVAWCRGWTWAWVAFFAANAAIAEALALAATPDLWALYNGGIAYGLMGLMFAVEYVVRKARFGRFDDHPLDRALARLLGRRAEGGAR